MPGSRPGARSYALENLYMLDPDSPEWVAGRAFACKARLNPETQQTLRFCISTEEVQVIRTKLITPPRLQSYSRQDRQLVKIEYLILYPIPSHPIPVVPPFSVCNGVPVSQSHIHVCKCKRTRTSLTTCLNNDQLLHRIVALAPVHPVPSGVRQRAAHGPHDGDGGLECAL